MHNATILLTTSLLSDQVSTHKHLGVVLSDDLSWEPHILSTVARSNRLLDLLKRMRLVCHFFVITTF